MSYIYNVEWVGTQSSVTNFYEGDILDPTLAVYTELSI